MLITVVVYLSAMNYNAFESTWRTNWVGGTNYVGIGIGTFLFLTSSCLMLAGYTLKPKFLLRLLSLIAAILICYNAVLYFEYFVWDNTNWISTPVPEALMATVLSFLVPGFILLSVSLAIALANLILHLRVRKKKKVS